MQGLPCSAPESTHSSKHVLTGNSHGLPNAYAAVLGVGFLGTIKPRVGQLTGHRSPSVRGRTTLGQEGAIIFGLANIDLPGEHSSAEP